jgi:hypothetical protein
MPVVRGCSPYKHLRDCFPAAVLAGFIPSSMTFRNKERVKASATRADLTGVLPSLFRAQYLSYRCLQVAVQQRIVADKDGPRYFHALAFAPGDELESFGCDGQKVWLSFDREV